MISSCRRYENSRSTTGIASHGSTERAAPHSNWRTRLDRHSKLQSGAPRSVGASLTLIPTLTMNTPTTTQSSTAETWLKNTSTSLPPRDARLLAKAQSTLLGNILPPLAPEQKTPWHPYRGICPAPERFRGMWNWDTAFHAVGVSRWDSELAREQIRIFLDIQEPDGRQHDNIKEDGSRRSTSAKPPVMGWAVERLDKAHRDDAFLNYAYPILKKNESWWRKGRGGDQHGFFHYNSNTDDSTKHLKEAKFESGWDNSVRWDEGITNLWPIDLNCYMVTFYRSLAYMAERLHLPSEQTDWENKATSLSERILETHYEKATGCFWDFDYEKKDFRRVLTPASFMPLWIGIATRDQADAMARLASDPKKLYPGMPTVAYDDPQFDAAKGYWRGPTWLNTAYFALKGLKNYGYDSTADFMKNTILDWCDKDEALREHYNPKTGEGIRARSFGWSAAFVIEFILNWDLAK
jgi:putative isomerase